MGAGLVLTPAIVFSPVPVVESAGLVGRGSKLRKFICRVHCIVAANVDEDYLLGEVVDVESHLLRGLDSLAA